MNPWREVAGLGVKAHELLFWVGGIEATDSILSLASFAARKVSVLSFVPLNLKTETDQKVVEEPQNVALAALLRDGMLRGATTAMEQLNWVLDELAFPSAMAAVWESRRGTGSENREARTRGVGDSER
jgi:hypothetical protein